jgi:hypothetical protein
MCTYSPPILSILPNLVILLTLLLLGGSGRTRGGKNKANVLQSLTQRRPNGAPTFSIRPITLGAVEAAQGLPPSYMYGALNGRQEQSIQQSIHQQHNPPSRNQNHMNQQQNQHNHQQQQQNIQQHHY